MYKDNRSKTGFNSPAIKKSESEGGEEKGVYTERKFKIKREGDCLGLGLADGGGLAGCGGLCGGCGGSLLGCGLGWVCQRLIVE